MATVLRHTHESAAEAFAELRPGKKPVRSRKLAQKICIAARAAGLRADGRQGLDLLLHTVFRNNSSKLGHLLVKSIKIVEDDATGDAVVFSDVYHVDENALEEVAKLCADHGLGVTGLVIRYPRTEYAEGYVPDASYKMVNEGYPQLYRGCLAGLRFAGSASAIKGQGVAKARTPKRARVA